MAAFQVLHTVLLTALLFTYASAATFNIINRCSYTVWAAAKPGGGRQLNSGQSWTINVPAGTSEGRIWARTGCHFDGSGRGSCKTGDCGGVLQCTGYGKAPNTLAEFALNQKALPYYTNKDFIDISLVAGFNVPMNFLPTSGCSKGPTCSANMNAQCPSQWKTTGGCYNPCNTASCGRYFKNMCPDAYSYPNDDATSTFICPGGTNYKVVFCP